MVSAMLVYTVNRNGENLKCVEALATREFVEITISDLYDQFISIETD